MLLKFLELNQGLQTVLLVNSENLGPANHESLKVVIQTQILFLYSLRMSEKNLFLSFKERFEIFIDFKNLSN